MKEGYLGKRCFLLSFVPLLRHEQCGHLLIVKLSLSLYRIHLSAFKLTVSSVAL